MCVDMATAGLRFCAVWKGLTQCVGAVGLIRNVPGVGMQIIV